MPALDSNADKRVTSPAHTHPVSSKRVSISLLLRGMRRPAGSPKCFWPFLFWVTDQATMGVDSMGPTMYTSSGVA